MNQSRIMTCNFCLPGEFRTASSDRRRRRWRRLGRRWWPRSSWPCRSRRNSSRTGSGWSRESSAGRWPRPTCRTTSTLSFVCPSRLPGSPGRQTSPSVLPVAGSHPRVPGSPSPPRRRSNRPDCKKRIWLDRK